MTLLRNILLLLLGLHLYRCNGPDTPSVSDKRDKSRPVLRPSEQNDYDNINGIGRFSNIQLSSVIDKQKAVKGKRLFEQSCSACHRLSEDVINGPGLKNITTKHQPAWILNLLTNTTEMLQKDPALAAKTEVYQSRMPNLQLTDEQAFLILEYLRQNDVVRK